MEIRKLTVANEEKIKSSNNAFFDLGITSQKSAVLLNYLLQTKLTFCPSKRGYFYSTKTTDNVLGGGLLIKCEAQITINEMNEVGVYFRNSWSIDRYLRIARGNHSEELKSIKDKIGNELKKLWKNKGGDDNSNGYFCINVLDNTKIYGSVSEHLDIDKNLMINADNGSKMIVISYKEYRALYEYLKGRDTDKIKERYGAEAYENMIGARVEDQFLLAAIDVIKNEIKNVEQNYSDLCKQADADFNEAYKVLRTQHEQKKMEVEKAKIEKIGELQQQMRDLLSGAIGAMA